MRLLFANSDGTEVKPGTAAAELVNLLLDKLYDDLMNAGIEMVDFQEVVNTGEPASKLDLSDTFPLTEPVVYLDQEDILVKVSYTEGKPNTVEEFDVANKRWGRSMSVLAGTGKSLHDALITLPRDARRVPEGVAAGYGKLTGKCLMCGRSLTSTESLAAGYGHGCRGKLR